MHFLVVEEEFLMLLKAKYFQQKLKTRVFQTAPKTRISDLSNLKTLIPKQILQRLPIVLSQVKAGNTS